MGSNNGTLTNMDPATDWVAGKIGNALDFDGSNDYVDTNNSVVGNADNVTFGGWVRLDNKSSTQGIFQRGKDSYGIGWSLLIDYQHLVDRFRASVVTTSAGPTEYTVASLGPATIGEWYHVMAVWNAGNSIKLYINGVLQDTINTTSTSLRSSTIGFRIGVGHENNFFDGRLDDLRIYNRVLTTEEVSSLYNGGAGCP